GRRGAGSGAADGEPGRAQEALRRVLPAPDGGRAVRLPLRRAAGVRGAPGLRGVRPDPHVRRDLPVAEAGALDRQVSDELAWLGIAELGPRLARRELSPVELCRALLARCERLEPRLNAFVTLSPERILAEAAAAEAELRAGRRRGPLHGVPIAVKDLCWTRGERTTAGSKVLAGFVPGADAVVVARLRAAGAIVFGKTNTPEFAYGPLDAYHYG